MRILLPTRPPPVWENRAAMEATSYRELLLAELQVDKLQVDKLPA